MQQPDYYEVLQISPNAEPETVDREFRILPARYHPANPETGDAEKCLEFTDNSDYVINGDGTEYLEGHSPKQESLMKLLSAPQARGKTTQAKAASTRR